MKNIKFLTILIIALISFNSCKDDDEFIFVASEAQDLAFSTTFLDEYLLNPTISSNIAERFTWNDADFDVPSEVTYKLQYSLSPDFSVFNEDLNTLGTTNGNELAVTIGQMLTIAEEAGLDNDPSTDDKPNTGELYFRLKAVLGLDGLESFSVIQALTVVLQEATLDGGPNCPSIWVVGAGAADAGWNWDSPIEFLCTDDVFKTNINLINDAFRFFLTEGDWDSGQNFPYYVGEGYSIDSNLEDALDGDNNFKFTGTPGKYLLTVDSINKTITLGPPEAEESNCPSTWVVGAGAVDAGWNWDSPIEFSCTDNVFSTNINLINDTFRFFLTEGDWDSGQNFPYYVNEGYTIDPKLEDALDGDNNFRFTGTPGKYLMTVDAVNKTITLGIPRAEEANCESVWIVGAAAVDAGWNWDSPIEFTCVDNVYSANINLTNDAFRFFLTEGDWDSGQNFPYYVGEGYTIDSNFEDALDGDNNFKFIGTPGTYYLTVDTVHKIISLR